MIETKNISARKSKQESFYRTMRIGKLFRKSFRENSSRKILILKIFNFLFLMNMKKKKEIDEDR
jgi:hypothetical protein